MLASPFYAAALTPLFIVLSVRTVMLRRKLKIIVGAGDSPQLLRAMRAHANFAEYAPLALLLLFLLESLGGAIWLIHALGICLLAGRLVHAYGISQSVEDIRYRVTGMALTFATLGVAALAVFGRYLQALAS